MASTIVDEKKETSSNDKLEEKLSNTSSNEVHVEVHNVLPDGSVDPVYQRKALILNQAIQEIGMGRYQWHLFIVTGFGYFADNLWPIGACCYSISVIDKFLSMGFDSLRSHFGPCRQRIQSREPRTFPQARSKCTHSTSISFLV
jgi:hypothetical protein